MTNSRKLLVAMLTSLIVLGAGPKCFADSIVYSNPYSPAVFTSNLASNCVFDNACDAELSLTDIVAQGFTLASGAVITSANFTELDGGVSQGPTSANWAFYTNSGGLPGTLLASGAAAIDGAAFDGIGVFSEPIDTYSFNVPSVDLGSGSYFFAFSTISRFNDFLAEGQTNSGAAQFLNGGPWTAGYGFGSIDGVAVELDGNASTVPEPSSLLLLGSGLVGFAGLVRRRIRRQAI